MKYEIAAVLAVIAVSGCATSETVFLRNAGGQTVKCGPYAGYGNLPAQADQANAKLRDCVSDYQRQGYERVPAQ